MWEKKCDRANVRGRATKVTKQGEEGFERQLEIQVKEKGGKLEAAIEKKQKKQREAEKKGQVKKKPVEEKEDEVMGDAPATLRSMRRRRTKSR